MHAILKYNFLEK